jgi:hypothetical protein
MCLHLFQHALYFLWMDFHPCLHIYTGFSLNEDLLKLHKVMFIETYLAPLT